MDENLKKQAELIFDAMGMNITTAFTIFTKAVVSQGKIPFEITAIPHFKPLKEGELNKIRFTTVVADSDTTDDTCWVDKLTGIISLPEEDKHKSTKELIAEGLWEDYVSLN